MKTAAHISRILTGLVFLFSGFVKGVDPLGMTYRIEDYFIAYGTEWAIPMALTLTLLLCTLEFMLGFAMFFNLGLKKLSWILLGLMIFFLILTFFDAIYNPVPDCGCFGDAIKLTNWQTFYKNIVLFILAILIFAYRKKFRPLPGIAGQWAVLGIAAAGFFAFSIYQYRHLPCIDFMDWKKGTDLVPDNPGVAKIYLIYRNKATGETAEFLSPNYPWNDSTWLSQWEFVDQRIDDSGVVKGHSLVIFDMEGNDATDYFISNPSWQFLLVAYDLEIADPDGMEAALRLGQRLTEQGFSFILLTGSLQEEIENFQAKYPSEVEYYNADDTELKIMVRANPGLVLIRDGVVIDKWHYHDLPGMEQLDRDYFSASNP